MLSFMVQFDWQWEITCQIYLTVMDYLPKKKTVTD